VQSALQELVSNNEIPAEAPLHAVVVEPPKQQGHGDFATNVAMVLAKSAKMPPRDLAEKIKALLLKNELIEAVEVAGPGFINMSLSARAFDKEINELFTKGAAPEAAETGRNERVLVEFVSINPTGPIHVGHGRNAVLGDVLCRLLARTGYEVYREYLVNDAGNQILGLVLSVHAAIKSCSASPCCCLWMAIRGNTSLILHNN